MFPALQGHESPRVTENRTVGISRFAALDAHVARRQFTSAKDLLPRVVGALAEDQRAAILGPIWAELVGEPACRHSKPVLLSGGTLVVEADGAPARRHVTIVAIVAAPNVVGRLAHRARSVMAAAAGRRRTGEYAVGMTLRAFDPNMRAGQGKAGSIVIDTPPRDDDFALCGGPRLGERRKPAAHP